MSFFEGIGNIFGFGKKTEARLDELENKHIPWEEFPWNKFLIEEDIIKKWEKVDMKHINHLLANFDIEQAKFIGIDLEELSIVCTPA